MKHNKKLFVLLGFIFIAAFNVNAQETLTLSLKQALKYALENKAEAVKGSLDVTKSEYQIQEKRAELLPSLSVEGNLINNVILQQTALPGEILGEPGTVVMASLNQKWDADGGIYFHQKIFDQSVFIGLKAAKTTREFYQINKKLTDETIIEKIAAQYYQVLILQARLQAIDTSYQNTLQIQHIIQEQFNNGLTKGIDLKRIQVKVFNLHAERQELRNTVQINQNTIKFLIGLPVDNPIILNDDPLDFLITGNEDFSVATLNVYKLFQKQKDLLTYQVQEVKATGYPTLTFNAQYHYQGLGDQFPIGKDEAQQVYWADYASVSLNLQIPIFSGFKTNAKARYARIELEEIKLDLADQERSLRISFENAKNQLDNSKTTIENQKQNVELAQQVVADVQNNYTNGLAPLTDVLDAETSLTEAQNNYNKALLDYRLAQLEYLKSKGQLPTLLK